ncbi:bifunctional [glutamine synthetase] adenylyltransferase/[glutamine synthetase]-adenylyl-L-tyrosine phosphorylase [Terrarubrum flagellatum]|uniref:bifunctional [glutamine synthetase] adenylyltransferase/[glutamine synthetase]-adenylyl-L-tyrosine phosphorylase n=1 Tax=Terrirubrum flagellatum TaxID=2895980 RepID=UPI0031452284
MKTEHSPATISLAASVATAPLTPPRRRADRICKEQLLDNVDDAERAAFAKLFERHPRARDLIGGALAHSPFLASLIRRRPIWLLESLSEAPDALFSRLIAETDAAAEFEDEADIMRTLRQTRARSALLIALADLGGVWSVDDVVQALTRFADAAMNAAVRWLLRQARERGKLVAASDKDLDQASGLIVLALGKHGAGELNYSSDIDIIVFYDPECAHLAPDVDASDFFVRLTKGIVRLLHQHTPDGYVARVDLRLRPDPGSTASAISVNAAHAYYETVGQNWERAAFIKARPIAGDRALGAAFLEQMRPFIWRKYFDFAAIADIHAMKRQIQTVKGHDEIALAGHDIKLGRGGIREIEFFVQTQQLVFGGRRPALRGSRTLDMLGVLVTEGWIDAKARDELSECYRFLRSIEHRLQMRNDEQTQRLPLDENDLSLFARFAGFERTASFASKLSRIARIVQKHYALLFEEGETLAVEAGSLVFTGKANDPETLATLRGMGFRDPAAAAETVRGWHFGRRPAVTTPRAREILTELAPILLQALGRTVDPDGAIVAFDKALASMPAAIELFSILKSYPALLSLFADILGSAPRLTEIVGANPHVLDAVIDPSFVKGASDFAAIEDRISRALEASGDVEDFLDRARDIARQEMFLTGARLLSGVISPEMAGQAYARIAEAIIARALAVTRAAFEKEHGRVPGARIAVLALGRLGARDLTASSDLDLIVVYDFDPEKPSSSGARPLHATTYFIRLVQRLVTALTAPTRRGLLYDIDLRLRPDGKKSPIATQWRGFLSYHESEAETWEQMALTRARVIAGDAAFAREVTDAVSAILRKPRDHKKISRDVAEMRKLIASEKGEDDPDDLKNAAGGLTDCEFLAQHLTLAHAASETALVGATSVEAFRIARDKGWLTADEEATLEEAYGLLRDVLQLQRLAVKGAFVSEETPLQVRNRIANAVGLPDDRALAAHLTDTRRRVREIFRARLRP